MATQQTSIQMFYKPGPGQPGYDAKNPQAVYDTNGNIISLQQYKQATGQAETPDTEVNWSAVQPGIPAGGFTGGQVFDPNTIPGLTQVWGQLTPAQQAFVQSAHGVVQSQYNAGGAATVDQDTWNKALQIASTDPSIKSQYGDAAAVGSKDLAFQLGQITGNYDADLAKQQADMAQGQKALQQQIAQAGQAYSGFGQQAKQELGAQQNQLITSTRSQYANKIQTLGKQYEQTYGSAALAQAPALSIGSGANQLNYNPTGNVTGTNVQNQTNAEINTATNLGLLPSASRTTGQVSTTGQ